MKAFPHCHCTHVVVKAGLCQFGAAHKHLIGTGADETDELFNRISLSMRILMNHYRRCKLFPQVWATCRNVYTGAADHLVDVGRVVQRVKSNEEVPREPSASELGTFDLRQLSQEAPTPPFFQVLDGKNVRQRSAQPCMKRCFGQVLDTC